MFYIFPLNSDICLQTCPCGPLKAAEQVHDKIHYSAPDLSHQSKRQTRACRVTLHHLSDISLLSITSGTTSLSPLGGDSHVWKACTGVVIDVVKYRSAISHLFVLSSIVLTKTMDSWS